jgi:cyclopropane fatty-acyl-phospholipid synthase-like methyltransferase
MSDYIRDEALMGAYNEYQQKYASELRESDRVILDLIAAKAGEKYCSILDIGCSTGNLLRHIGRAFPGHSLTGGDLTESSLAEARKTAPQCKFQKMDMLAIEGRYDIIIANAVAFSFDYGTYEKAITSVATALNPGGLYIAFEMIHPFQDLQITETDVKPNDLVIYSRNEARVERILCAAGLSHVQFCPFSIPIDLPEPEDKSNLTSYTRRLDSGERLCFRGALYQPWCHMTAVKA